MVPTVLTVTVAFLLASFLIGEVKVEAMSAKEHACQGHICSAEDVFIVITESKEWAEAADYCKGLQIGSGIQKIHAELASLPESNVVHRNIIEHLSNENALANPENGGYWIGCNCSSSSECSWVSGLSVTFDKVRWANGQPNMRGDDTCQNRDTLCCRLWKTNSFLMDDACCKTKSPFICHFNLTGTGTSFDLELIGNLTGLPYCSREREADEVTRCESETIVDDNSGLFIRWPSQKAGTPAVQQCPQDHNNATRLCSYVSSPAGRLQAEWESPNTSDCSLRYLTRSGRLKNLAKFSGDTPPGESKKILTQLKNLTSGAEGFNEGDVTNSIDVLKTILESRRNGTEVDVAEIMLRIVDNLLRVDRRVLMASQRKRKAATRLIRIIEKLALAVNFGNRSDDTGNTSSVTIATPNIYVMVTKVDATDFYGLTFKTSPIEGEVTGQNKEETSISLPTSLFDNLDPAERDLVKRAQFITYKSNTFFQAIDDTTSTRLSTIVAASIGDFNITNLTEPVEIKIEHENSSTANSNATCMFWDFSLNDGRGAWSTEGCAVSSNADYGENTIVCACNHLTNFAVLVDVYDEAQHFDSANKKALSVVSYIGCGISLLALALTLVSLIGCRKRSDKANKILINLCSALFLTLLIFLVDSLVVGFAPIRSGLCTTIAALLHFFLLAVFLWMALQAVYMYLMLVKVFETYIVHFMVKFCLVGWGFPLAIVVITLSVDVQNYGYYSEICWLSRYPFYAALLAPLCLVLIFNSIIYCLVIYQICGLNSKAMTANERYSYMSQLRAAVGLMVLLGLTWVFAIFAVGEASLMFNYLFAIFNSLQGLFMFLFHCVLKKEIKNGWKKFCCQSKTTRYTVTDESGKTLSSSALKNQASETTKTETNLDSSTSTQYHIDSQFERNGRQAQKD